MYSPHLLGHNFQSHSGLLCLNDYGIWNLHQSVKRQIRAICHSQREKATEPAPHFQKYLTYFVNICCPPRISTVEPTLPIWVSRKVTVKSLNHKHAGSWGTRDPSYIRIIDYIDTTYESFDMLYVQHWQMRSWKSSSICIPLFVQLAVWAYLLRS